MSEDVETCCKVGEAIVEYDLDDDAGKYETFDERLVARWKGEDIGNAQGYRPLTDWFNKRLLRQAYERADVPTTGNRLDQDYETLGEDDLQAEELRDSLRSIGLDVDTVENSFVSWSTMQRHLKNCLEEEKERQRASTDWERNSIDFARDQLRSKVEDALTSLDSKGELHNNNGTEIAVTIELSCPECPLRVPFERALEQGYVCDRHSDRE